MAIPLNYLTPRRRRRNHDWLHASGAVLVIAAGNALIMFTAYVLLR